MPSNETVIGTPFLGGSFFVGLVGSYGNCQGRHSRPPCCKDCGSVVDGKHIETAQRLPRGKKSEWKENHVKHKQEILYKIPEGLIKEQFQKIHYIVFSVKLSLNLST